MKTSSMKDNKLIFISIILIILLWGVLANVINNDIYLPRINKVLKEIVVIVIKNDFIKNIGYSLLRGGASFFIALVLAIFLGIVSGFNKIAYNFFYPINSILKSIPTIAFILIALIWVNKNYAPYLIGIVIAFPILYESVINSILNSNKNLEEMMNSFNLGFLTKLFNLHIQFIIISISQIATSVFSLVFKVVIAGEVFGQPNYGIGTAIQKEKINFSTSGIFAWIIIVAVLCFIIDKIILLFINKSLKGGRYLID
ncbi:ABC transporter permease [Clostridium sp. Sa3CUN1]|uniref:ABC transporter permease n=1 Tax=Clostridium gallinarum TaxID=2762246 RepID=A0ABR8PZY5_9CLOT|nr:ABC transporter permease subunit [Clostridium gallinarum]MBD7913718.1 ABC transporter permease [Clostridium gallinarum]